MTKPVFEFSNISKSFGMTHALRDISFDLLPGEVHAIVGENGAGKSTLIKIMTGIHQPSSGEILIDGSTSSIPNPQVARQSGIVAIYQEPMVFPDLSVAENIFLNASNESIIVNRKRQSKKAEELISRIGISLDVEQSANGLTLAEQQAVEIARALSEDVRILIMDEPTASLSGHEALRLRRIAKNLASEGVAVVYISHRLEEIFEIADRVTVLRDGSHISTRPTIEVTTAGLISDMVGRNVEELFSKTPSSATDESLLEVEGLAVDGVFEGIDLTLGKGEILCMSGLVGARRTDVALTLFGILHATSGIIRIFGKEVTIRNPRQAMELGLAYVSEDRRKLGLAMPLTISANISLATLENFLNRFGLIKSDEERKTAEQYRKRLNIRTPDVEMAVGMLSGGNQQKTMLAKWLNLNPKILIFDEPTRGIDIGAKAEVHGLIREFVKLGGAALVISSDLPEVLTLADRILIMREGRQMGILSSQEASSEKVMALATGQDGY